MRTRRLYKRFEQMGGDISAKDNLGKTQEPEKETKEAKPSKSNKTATPLRFLERIVGNPNFNLQMVVILLTLASENMQMDRRIDGMTTTVDKIRGITDVIGNTMQSIKVATEAPKQIRRLLE